jgi:hypothetical protein
MDMGNLEGEQFPKIRWKDPHRPSVLKNKGENMAPKGDNQGPRKQKT